jgi:hypothetical protein
MGFRGRIGGLLTLAVLSGLAAGCGDSSSSANQAASKSNKIEASTPSEGEPSRAFLVKGKKNETATFGEEASAKERVAASKVLEENLQAREDGDWAVQCATLSQPATSEVKQGAAAQGVAGGGCAKELAGRAKPLKRSAPLRENTMTGPIDALRFKGSNAYALFHGTGGRDYAMPMEKVDGEWKVGAILTEELEG